MFTYKLLTFSVLYPTLILSQPVPKIAIIGGGIGGTSCAYFLKQLFQNKADITLFEKNSVGGRLKLMDVDGKYYESGGSVIHHQNQYMVQFSKLLGLGIRKPQSTKLGIYDGEKFIFEENDWYFLTIADLIWHYGLSVFHLYRDVGAMMNDFEKIYNFQENGYAYTTVDQLLNAMNPSFTNMTKTSISKVLLQKGYSQKFLDEFVQAVMMVNYGQTNDISGFAGYVSLAGAEDELWSVEGGNKLVPEGLLKFSEAKFLTAKVQEVELLPDGKFSVTYQEPSSGDHVKKDRFDVVVLAAPLIQGSPSVKFVNFSKNFEQYERPYHQTVSTFVKGTLKPTAFNNQVSLPDEILTNNDNLPFNSIAKCTPVGDIEKNNEKSVFKVFSQKPLSKESVEKLFDSVSSVKEKVWLAYPHYDPPEKFVPFILHPGFYYINAIELSASAMEMSAIAAKNIALLIFNSWKNAADKIDIPSPILKDEL